MPIEKSIKSGQYHYITSQLYKNYSTTTQKTTKNSLYKSLLLLRYIQRHQLTDALQLLEESGLSEDLAIFAMAVVQKGDAL